jgi:precorrin-6B methylase 2
MLDRLKFVAACLEKLHENGYVRSEGNQVFQEGRAELDDIIATYTEPVAAPAPIVYNVVTMEALHEAIEASDVAVMGAIAQSQAEVIEALSQPAA